MKNLYTIAALFIAGLSFGQVVNPSSATTTFTPVFGTSINTVIDGTGLEFYPSAFCFHTATTPGNSFVGQELTGNIDFVLGDTFDIDGVAFWNQNTGGPNSNIGLNEVSFLSSLDGVNYTLHIWWGQGFVVVGG